MNRQEQKSIQQTEKIGKMKVYQKCFKNSMASQCKFCHSFYPTEIFLEHIRTCSKDINNFSRSHFFQMLLECYIKDTYIETDPVDHRNYTVYVLNVSFNGEKQWEVKQQYRSFCQLHEALINQYPSVQFPKSSIQFAQKSFNEFKKSVSNSTLSFPGSGVGHSTASHQSTSLTDRRNTLQAYVQDLLMIPAIKESNHLKQFLGIKEHFPEFYNDSLDQLKAKDKYYSLQLKEFTIDKPEKSKGELTKFITRPKDPAASYATVVEESKNTLEHSKSSKSKTNLRYQVQKDHELDISPELRAPPQMYQEAPP